MAPTLRMMPAPPANVASAILRRCEREAPENLAAWTDAAARSPHEDLVALLRTHDAATRAGEPEVFREHARWLADVLVSRGMPRAAVANVLDSVAAELSETHGATSIAWVRDARRDVEEGVPPRGGSLTPTLGRDATRMVGALASGDRSAAFRIIDEKRRDELPFAAIVDSVVRPAMQEMGRRWQHAEATISQEHAASAIVQAILARAGGASHENDTHHRAPRAIVAGVEGNLHALGIAAVADALQDDGWDVRYLGADVPNRDLVQEVERLRPDLLALSVSLAEQAPAARSLVERLRARLGDDTPRIVAGGRALEDHPSLARFIGAEPGGTDARSAVAHAQEAARRST